MQIKCKLSIWLHRNWLAMPWLKISPQRAEEALASNQLPPAKLFITTDVYRYHKKNNNNQNPHNMLYYSGIPGQHQSQTEPISC